MFFKNYKNYPVISVFSCRLLIFLQTADFFHCLFRPNIRSQPPTYSTFSKDNVSARQTKCITSCVPEVLSWKDFKKDSWSNSEKKENGICTEDVVQKKKKRATLLQFHFWRTNKFHSWPVPIKESNINKSALVDFLGNLTKSSLHRGMEALLK